MCEAGMNYVPVAEAARLLETTEMRVLMMLKKNELQGKMVEEAWYVDKASLNLCEKPRAADVVPDRAQGARRAVHARLLSWRRGRSPLNLI